MKKIQIILCCAECSAYCLQKERIPFCCKMNRRIDDNSDTLVNPALIGFPAWCPLETVSTFPTAGIDYKKEVKKMMQIMADETVIDPLQEASHYLNSVIQSAENKTKANQL